MASFTGTDLATVSLESGDHPAHNGASVDVKLLRGFIGGAGSAEPPTVVFVEPTPPNLPSPGRSIVLEVTDADGFAALLVLAEYGTGAYEVVHDGDAFAQVYAAQSTRVSIAGGYRYTLKRAGGWFGERVTIRVVAVDVYGDVG